MTSLSKSTHHISFDSDDLLSFNEDAFKKVESLRTLFQLKQDKKIPHYIPTNHFLRALRTNFIDIPSLGSLIHLSLEKGHSLAELRDLNLGGELSIKGLNNVGSLSEAQEANLMGKKDLQELCLSWKIRSDEITKTPAINVEQNCVRLPSLGKLRSLKRMDLYDMVNLTYLDDECHHGMEVNIFPSLEELYLINLPNIEGLLKVERGELFPCLSYLEINDCPKLGLPCLPSVEDLQVWGCNNELLRSISTFCSLTTLYLSGSEGITSFPEGMFTNLTFLKTLYISEFPKLKELPNEPFNLALEFLTISNCNELESLPEQIWESQQSLRKLQIWNCKGLRCLPEDSTYSKITHWVMMIVFPKLAFVEFVGTFSHEEELNGEHGRSFIGKPFGGAINKYTDIHFKYIPWKVNQTNSVLVVANLLDVNTLSSLSYPIEPILVEECKNRNHLLCSGTSSDCAAQYILL
ncbi:hypothetical protein P8452_43731 [Trifolium repens]|nr:hypothetical protein P8452_43731 [Trifolium repens]